MMEVSNALLILSRSFIFNKLSGFLAPSFVAVYWFKRIKFEKRCSPLAALFACMRRRFFVNTPAYFVIQ